MDREQFQADIGQLLRRLRIAHGMTQEHVGQAVGLERTSISNIEKGHQGVSAVMLVELLDVFGMQLTVIENLTP